MSKKFNTYSSLRPKNSEKKSSFNKYLKSDNASENFRTPTPNFKERPKSKQISLRENSVNSKLGSTSDPGVKGNQNSFFFKENLIN